MPHIAAKHKPTPSHSAGDAECAEPASPSARIMVCGTKFGGGPARERKEGEAPSLEDHLNHCGLGWFQYNIFIMAALIVAADGMEMTVISLLRKPLSDEWALNDDYFSLLGSTVFLGLLIGNLIGGYLADLFGRKKCIIAITVVFCVFGIVSALAPDVYVFAISRFFTGIGVGSMVPVSDSHLLEWSPSAWRAKLAMTLTGVYVRVCVCVCVRVCACVCVRVRACIEMSGAVGMARLTGHDAHRCACWSHSERERRHKSERGRARAHTNTNAHTQTHTYT